METTTAQGTFPQCYESHTPFGGRILEFLPGHGEAGTRHPHVIGNIKILMDEWLPESDGSRPGTG